MITPNTILELSHFLRERNNEGHPLEEISLTKLDRVVCHSPQDLTVTVESGTKLKSLQNHLAKSGQWLPLDPPNVDALTIQEILDRDLSGPRRFGFGTARDWVIGVKGVLADGRIIESGGKVVKNVAGYDLHKLFIGARGELAILTEVTFKVNPLPEKEAFLTAGCADFDDAKQLLQELMTGPLTPHVLDIHTMGKCGLNVVIGFEGSSKEVDWQVAHLPDPLKWQPTDLEYSEALFKTTDSTHIKRSSVVPSELLDALKAFPEGLFVARVANGVIYRVDPNLVPHKVSPIESRIRDLFNLSSRVEEKIEGLE